MLGRSATGGGTKERIIFLPFKRLGCYLNFSMLLMRNVSNI